MVVQPLAECRMRFNLGIANSQIRVGRIIPQAILARTALDLRHALTPQMLISKQRCRRSCLVRTLENCCERHAIFNRLIGALSEMGKHRMSSITEKSQSSPGPGRKRLAVIQGPPEGCLHLVQEVLDTRVPAGEFPPQHLG